MLRVGLSLRYLALVASLGAALGAMLMFWEGMSRLFGAFADAVQAHGIGASVVAAVMASTDAFLFGIVLIIFAYAITFGLVFSLSDAVRNALPPLVRLEGIKELKHTLIEVIIVYLVVDFATDLAEGDTQLSWETLVKPASILLIAAALRLLGSHRGADQPHGSPRTPASPPA